MDTFDWLVFVFVAVILASLVLGGLAYLVGWAFFTGKLAAIRRAFRKSKKEI